MCKCDPNIRTPFCCKLGCEDTNCKIAGRIEQLEYVAKALLEYIDAIPLESVANFPAMPGIDRDFVDDILNP